MLTQPALKSETIMHLGLVGLGLGTVILFYQQIQIDLPISTPTALEQVVLEDAHLDILPETVIYARAPRATG